jgi:hypothetical protein
MLPGNPLKPPYRKWATPLSFASLAGFSTLMLLHFLVNLLETATESSPSLRLFLFVYTAALGMGYLGWRYGRFLAQTRTERPHTKD